MVSKGFMNRILTQVERREIESIVKEVELKTSGEIVIVLARQSDDYIECYFRSLAFFSILAGISVQALDVFWPASPALLIPGEFRMLLFQGLGLCLARFRFVRALLTTQTERTQRSRLGALTAFSKMRISDTKASTGVLIYISLFERHVEILADKGIHSRVGAGFWTSEVAILVDSIRQRRLRVGLETVIREIGGKLQENFPPGPTNPNELPDTIIIQ